jgi:hypothetical protein
VRVLVTGSRTWTDAACIRRELNCELTLRSDDLFVLVLGMANRGADAIANAWAVERKKRGHPVEVERHPADWYRRGRRAGVIRNAEMVAAGADLCLAFIDPCASSVCRKPRPHGSHGAAHCAGLAEQAGIPTTFFRHYGGAL